MNPPRARAFGSLRSRNVRLFLGGQSVSLVGTWIQQVAMGWLAYRLTGSPLLLGVLAAAGQLPSLLLMPVAGGLSDRWSRDRILVITQSLAMGLTLVLAALALAGVVAVWHLVTIGALLGVVGALDVPARQAFVADMVESREDVGNAVALHASVTNAARLIGPSVGGAIVGTLALSGRRSLDRSATTIAFGAAVAGAALVLFAFSDALWLSLALMFATGLGVMLQLASSNALIQTVVADDRRGQVMGLYTMAFVGLAPVGTLRTRAPVAAKIALESAGAIVVVPGSPRPVGYSRESTTCTSTSGTSSILST